MTKRYLSICSGIEATTVAWHPLGFAPWAFAEIGAFPAAVLAQHYGSTPNLGDIRAFRTWPDAALDILVGGTPCQSFSIAGLRQGLADPRGNLTLVYLAIADRYRPEWLVWENVPGVLSIDNGRTFGTFVGGLAKLGYHAAWRVLDAQYVRVDGFGRAVPQRRRRVFVVGHLGDWRRAAAVLFEPESLSWDSPPRREAGKGIAGSTAYGIDSDCIDRSGGAVGTAGERSGLGVERELAYSIRAKRAGAVAFGGNDTSGPIDVATARNAHGGPYGRLDFDSETFIAFSCKDHGADAGEIAPTLRSMGHDGSHANAGGQIAIAIQDVGNRDKAQNGVGASGDGVAYTIDAAAMQGVAFDMRGREGGSQFEGPHDTGSSRSYIAQQWAVRRLTPRECERLQGFPDDYTLIRYRGRSARDGPRYKALGNSMAVNVMRWIGGRIALVDRLAADELRGAA